MQKRLKSSYLTGLGIVLTASWLNLSAASSNAATTASKPAATLKQTLQKLYSAQDAAAARKDADGVFATYSPDFINTDYQGLTENLATEKMSFSKVAAVAKTMKTTNRVQSVSVNGKTAVAIVKLHGEFALPNPQSGATVILGVDALSHDTWTKTAAGWRETASKTVGEQDTFNGKTLPNTVFVTPPPTPVPGTPALPAPPPADPAAPATAPAPAPAAPSRSETPAPPVSTPPATPSAPPSTAAKGS